MQRSSLGWYDTDPYNVLFPLLILLIMYRLFSVRWGHLWTIALAAVSAVYALFWQGWILIPVFVVLALLAVALYRVVKHESPSTVLGKLLLYLAGTALISSVLITPAGLVSALKEVFAIFFRFALIDVNPWPDLYLTVGELKRTSLLRITHLLGGFVFIAFSALGFIILALGKDTRTTREQQITVCVITAGCFLLAGSAERFAIFPLAPASLCLAIGLNAASSYLRKVLSSAGGGAIRPFASAAVNTLLCLTIISPAIYGHIVAERQNPIYNKVWDKVLTDIGSRTPDGSIVTTWWPPGHFIRAVAGRGVSFDGATLEMPQAYWVACFFLSDSEKEALGILRMLNTSGNRATEYLTESGIPLDKAVALVKKMVTEDKSAALTTALTVLPREQALELVSLTHGTPPPSYCLVYKDLIKNVLGLYFVKDWDFAKAMSIKDRADALSGKALRRGSKENIDLMWFIAGGQTYIGGESYETFREGDLIHFGNGVTLNTALMEARIDNLEGEVSGVPESIICMVKDGLVEKRMARPDIRLSVLFIGHSGGRFSCVVAPPDILSSVLFRLYYLNGTGLEHFSPFTGAENPGLNTKILVYRIDW